MSPAIGRVGANERNPDWDLTLADGVKGFGFKLDRGEQDIQEQPQELSTLQILTGGRRFGTGDPTFSHIEQRTWIGGRANEYYIDDPTRFYDSMALWTLQKGKAFPAGQWSFGEGYYYGDVKLPGANRVSVGRDVHWQPLLDTTRYGRKFTSTDNPFTATKLQVWIRKVGTPADDLKVEVYSDSSNEPNVSQASATVSASDIDELISVLHEFDLGAGFTEGSETDYWFVIYAEGAGDQHNHWQFAYGDEGVDTNKSSDDGGSTWNTEGVQPYFRLTADDVNRKWHFFFLEGALYAIDEQADGTASSLYINGTRGKATAGSSTSLTDSNNGVYGGAWPTNLWSDAYVRITKGTGAGQVRKISTNTGTVINVSSAWDINPSTDSEYIIYGTNEWVDITPSTGDQIDGVVQDVAVFNDIAIFAQGTGSSDAAMLKMRWDETASPPAHDFDDDGTNKADYLHVYHDQVNGVQVYRAMNDDVALSRSDAKAWNTALDFGDDIPIGDQTFPITNVTDHDGLIYVFKWDSIWKVASDRPTRVRLQVDAAPAPENGAAVAVQDFFLYFSFLFSVERLYQQTVDDVGPWRDEGMPDGRKGVAAALEPYLRWIFVGMDADDDTSSVLAYVDETHHEVFRAWAAGDRVQNVFVQPVPGGRNRLWISVGGDIVWVPLVKKGMNPLQDSEFHYQHEAHLITSTFDMNNLSLPKLFRDVRLNSDNLASGISIAMDYQLDDDVGTSSWVKAGTFRRSPEDDIEIARGDRRKIRLRFRLMTNESSTPPVINATILRGFTRTPVKRQWNVRLRLGSGMINRDKKGRRGPDADEVYRWLLNAAESAKDIRIRSKYSQVDDLLVIVQPPSFFRSFVNTFTSWYSGTISMTILEA